MVATMQGIDHVVESEELSWLCSWIEVHEREYDHNVRHLLARMLVVICALLLLWGVLGFSLSSVVTACTIAIFFACYSSVSAFFDDYLAKGMASDSHSGMSHFSLAIATASIFPLVLW
ncbi:hypothetical protein [Halomonas binhaiensis]|uniref:Uncharacterized protein n=1 Tax=Halomonas binhaiensis TaxID=2562282 RepID=A0A5C1NJC4_9GAMM|nr:hypothetical protein [Halomonas binhaiensis]QEM83446.1 hypothetical protein E4T21_19205 [Halomonas binhaiensis]